MTFILNGCLKMEIPPSLLDQLNFIETLGEKARWELYKDVVCCFDQILKAILNKTAIVRPHTPCLTYHQRRARHVGHCWWNKDEIIIDSSQQTRECFQLISFIIFCLSPNWIIRAFWGWIFVQNVQQIHELCSKHIDTEAVITKTKMMIEWNVIFLQNNSFDIKHIFSIKFSMSRTHSENRILSSVDSSGSKEIIVLLKKFRHR